MALTLSTTIRNSRMNAIRDALDAGSAAGKLLIYDGTRPATGGTATTLLATFTLSDPSAPNAVDGVLTFSAIATVAASATGTASWARMVDSDDKFVCDMDAGTEGADLVLTNDNLVSGSDVDVTSAEITDNNG